MAEEDIESLGGEKTEHHKWFVLGVQLGLVWVREKYDVDKGEGMLVSKYLGNDDLERDTRKIGWCSKVFKACYGS